MELILPTLPDGDPRAQLVRLANVRLQPFDPAVSDFLAAFAERVLSDRSLRDTPELVALAYWFRPAALAVLRARHQALAQQGLLRPRGVAFHIAPANVDSVFVYSWFLSLLCGNRNIVRLSRRDNPHRTRLLALLAELLGTPQHAAVRDANAVITYARSDAITAELSARCDLRVVWGGNETVRQLRAIALPPLATEVVFPDRQSWAMFDAAELAAADTATLARLAGAFYNDAFWFAQQACSSPRAVLWIGRGAEVETARARFWAAVAAELERRGEQGDASQLAARLVAAHASAAEGDARLHGALHDWPLRLDASAFSGTARKGHCGYGLFYEITRETLAETSALFAPADQSVAYWGFGREALLAWAQTLPDRAVDRIVRLGDALRFADRWDGHDLLLSFSRLLVIE